MILKGLYTALLTPFDSLGKVNEKMLRYLIKRQLDHEVDGLVLLGTTGEEATITDSEREMIIKIGVEEVKERGQLIIGTGTNSTFKTIERTIMAKKLGADAAIVITPYYTKPTQEGIFQHFQTLTSNVDFPICVYNCQSRTGTNIQTDTLKKLANLPHIVSVKEASGNINQISETIEMISRVHPAFTVLSGDDSLTLSVMALGGQGVISAASNLIPDAMKQLVSACMSGNMDLARSIHFLLSPLFRALFLETNPIPIKTAMNLCGFQVGGCRLPLCSLSSDNEKKLKNVLETLSSEKLV